MCIDFDNARNILQVTLCLCHVCDIIKLDHIAVTEDRRIDPFHQRRIIVGHKFIHSGIPGDKLRSIDIIQR